MKFQERMSPSQRYLFRNILKTSEKRAELVLKNSKLSNGQKTALARARERLQKHSRIVVNLNLNEEVFGEPMINSLLKSRRLYNVFEIAHAEMAMNPALMRRRIILEYKVYGATMNVQTILSSMSNTEHPNYGILDYFNEPVGISMMGTYGWYRFVLENDIKVERSTFTPRDSFIATSDEVFPFRQIDAILASRPFKKGKYWFEYVNAAEVPIDSGGRAYYVEAQVLGGVFLREKYQDVEVLCYPETDQFKEEFFKKYADFQRKNSERSS